MSRSQHPLIIKDTDKIVLEDMAAGRAVAGEDIITRARAILKMGEGCRLKDIARELNIRPNTVSDIRKRYLEKGLAGIGDSSRSGRPVKVEDHVIAQSLDAIINDAKTNNAAIPSVKELSETLHAPEAKIRSHLKEKGIIQGRQYAWDFPTSKGFIARWIDLVGLYLSPDQQVIIVRTCMDSSLITPSGKLAVRSRKLAAVIQTAADQEGFIGLTKALDVFNRFPAKTEATRTENALQFVQTVISGFPSSLSGAEYHLIVCGKQLIESGRTLIPGAYLHHADSLENWIAQVENIVSVLTQNSNKEETASGICSGIKRCLQLGHRMPDVFEWKKMPDNAVTDRPNAADCHEMKAADPPEIAPGTMRAVCQVMGDDGQWIEGTATSFCPFTQNAFDVSSTDAYLESLHQIEQAVISVTREAGRSFTEKYLNEIQKK